MSQPSPAPLGPSLRRRFVSGGAWAMAGRVSAGVALIVSNGMIARLLGPEGFGAYTMIFSVVILGATGAQLGMGTASVRLSAAAGGVGEPGRARSAVTRCLTAGLAGAVLAGAGAWFGARLWLPGGETAWAAGAASLWLMLVAVHTLLAEGFRGLHHLRETALFSGPLAGMVAPVLALLALGVVWWWPGSASLALILGIVAIASLLTVLIGGWRLGQLLPAGPGAPVAWRSIYRVAWPLWISAVLLATLAHVDVLLLGSHRSDEEVASYGAAARLAAVMLFPYVVANAATAASIAELYAQNRQRDLERVVRRLTSLVFAVTLALALGFVFVGEALMAGIYGEYYRSAATVLMVLAAGQLAAVGSGPGALMLMMTGYERTLMGLTLVSVAVLLGLGSWAAKVYGALGLAVAVATVQALQGIGVMLAARLRTGIWTCVKVARR